MNAERKIISISLPKQAKELILSYYPIILSEQTLADLNNKRRKTVRIDSHDLGMIIGELSYHFNRCYDTPLGDQLNELLEYLEYEELHFKRALR